MSGPAKASLIIALAVVVMACVNVVMWRRLKAALAEGRARAEVGGAVEGAEEDRP
jgi:hypothetical protein